MKRAISPHTDIKVPAEPSCHRSVDAWKTSLAGMGNALTLEKCAIHLTYISCKVLHRKNMGSKLPYDGGSA